MSGQLATPEAVDFTELRSRKRTANLPGMQLGAVLLQELAHSLGAAYLLKHAGILLSPLIAEIEGHERDYEVRGDETRLVIDEHNPVGIAVIDHADVGAGLAHELLQRLHVLRDQRVGLMVGKAPVYRVEDI